MADSTAAQSAPTKTNTPSKGHPLIFVEMVGFGMLTLFVIVLITQVQTTEAFVLHSGNVSVFKPDWGIILQIPALVVGQLPSSEAAAAIVGWGVELLYMGFIVGYELLKDSVHYASGPLLAKIFRSLGFVIIGFCGYTDYLYGTLGSGVGGHLMFALMCSAIVAYFGTIGWSLVVHGWKKA